MNIIWNKFSVVWAVSLCPIAIPFIFVVVVVAAIPLIFVVAIPIIFVVAIPLIFVVVVAIPLIFIVIELFQHQMVFSFPFLRANNLRSSLLNIRARSFLLSCT